MANTAKKPFRWDAEADRDLYAACLVVSGEPKGQTLGKAVELLHEMKGVSYTVKAATHRIQHLQKLKRKDGATTASTPVKGNSKKRGGKAAAVGGDDDDATPSAKRRATTTKKEALSTTVVGDDEEDLKPLKTVKQEVDEASEDGI